MHLKSTALQPGRVLKPAAAKSTVPRSRAWNKLPAPRVGYSAAYSPPLPAPCRNVPGMGHRSCSASAAKAKARDGAEPDDQPQAPAKEGEDNGAVAEGTATQQARPAAGDGRPVVQCGMAYQLFAAIYVCVYVLSWRTGELIFLNAQDALQRLRRYVVDKFSEKTR